MRFDKKTHCSHLASDDNSTSDKVYTKWARPACLDLDPIKETLFDLVFLAALNLDHGTVGMEVETEKYLLLIALLLQI